MEQLNAFGLVRNSLVSKHLWPGHVHWIVTEQNACVWFDAKILVLTHIWRGIHIDIHYIYKRTNYERVWFDQNHLVLLLLLTTKHTSGGGISPDSTKLRKSSTDVFLGMKGDGDGAADDVLVALLVPEGTPPWRDDPPAKSRK